MNGPDIKVGKVIKIDPDEARVIRECSVVMMDEALTQQPGWFERWCRAHKKAHGTLRQIIRRSWGLNH